jgi:hypothetical protein
MTRPSLTYVDSTILLALISAGPTGDAVRRWFRLSTDAWISSEIALTRTLINLPSGREGNPDAPDLLRALHAGVAIRPLPLRLLCRTPLPYRRTRGAQEALAIADALELASARLWRCGWLISNCETLQQAAQAAGLSSFGIGAPPATAPTATATVGDWPRRSPIQP